MPRVPARNSWRGRGWCVAILAISSIAGVSAQAPANENRGGAAPADAALSLPARTWAAAAATNQENIVRDDDKVPLRYTLRKVDRKGDHTREVVESRDGSVARLIQQDGATITAQEDSDERERLKGLLDDPEAFQRHHRRDGAEIEYALELIHSLPPAMLWSYAPGQPQQANAPHRQVVLDFLPDPNFKPPSIVTEGLTGVAGRMWVDGQTHCVARLELRVLHTVNFGWGGVLAKVNAGGTVEMDQAYVGEHRWIYTHVGEHLMIREVLVHTVAENAEINAWDVHVLPAQISYQEAVRELLALPVPTR